jgi:hypothetical protein
MLDGALRRPSANSQGHCNCLADLDALEEPEKQEVRVPVAPGALALHSKTCLLVAQLSHLGGTTAPIHKGERAHA